MLFSYSIVFPTLDTVSIDGYDTIAETLKLALRVRERYALHENLGTLPQVFIVNNTTGEIVIEKAAETPIENADFGVRAYNCLRRSGIDTVEQLLETPIGDISKIRNLGNNSFHEIADYVYQKRNG